jgi:hypothetical protein
MSHEETQKNLEQAGQNQASDKEKKKFECKKINLAGLKSCRSDMKNTYDSATSKCDWYGYGAVASGIGGLVAAVPSFGMGAAAGASGGLALGWGQQVCQRNAESNYTTHLAACESAYVEFDLTVCEQI